MRDILSQILSALIPVLTPVIAAYVALLVKKYVHNDAALKALDTLGRLTQIAVGNAAQKVVTDLKDPTKPGTWDAVAAAAVKASVTSDVKSLGQQPLAVLSANGMDIEKLIDHGIEAAVKAAKS